MKNRPKNIKMETFKSNNTLFQQMKHCKFWKMVHLQRFIFAMLRMYVQYVHPQVLAMKYQLIVRMSWFLKINRSILGCFVARSLSQILLYCASYSVYNYTYVHTCKVFTYTSVCILLQNLASPEKLMLQFTLIWIAR